MNANEFSDALGDVDGSYIAEAVTYRKRGRWIPWAAAAACLVLVFSLIPTPVFTGSGTEAYYAEGVALAAPLVTGGEGLVTEAIHITLDAPALIQGLREGETELRPESTATLSFTFHNPTDAPLDLDLTLPCGQAPRYTLPYEWEHTDGPYYPLRDLYRITANGIEVDPVLRITGTDALPIADGTWKTKRISPETIVTKYTYRITELHGSEKTRVAVNAPGQYSDFIAMVEIANGYETIHSNNAETTIPIAWGDYPEAGDSIILYIIGDAPDYQANWFFKDWDATERIPGSTALENTETMTFLEFAGQTWEERLGISLSDWAFALAAEIDPYLYLSSRMVDLSVLPFSQYNWYTYDLTIAPGETVDHEITVPLYPSWLLGGGNSQCTYTLNIRSLMDLCPTGPKTVTLETPLVMEKTSAQWVQDGDIYTLELTPPHDLEMSFTLDDPNDGSASPSYYLSNPNWVMVSLSAGILIFLYFLHRKIRREDRC